MPRYFTDKTFAFLEDLADNNDRLWFKANQDRYEEHVRGPAIAFIEDFADRLYAISPNFIADPSKVGGSLFRIQRDTRFAKDKTPYKTHAGLHFRHVASRDDVHAPGFYLHVEPGACYAGAGMWQPATPAAARIRQAIAEDPTGWKKAAHGKAFLDRYEVGGDSLVRVPKGFDPEGPFVEDIRLKDFIAGTSLNKRIVTAATFLDDYTALCKTAKPFMAFLCRAIGVAV
ncbi:MAG TPA: TIGR02453 family protein [Acidimicrobiia bacterium]|jgi:uncharacterized protein (TIGR02453 family)